MKNVQEEIKSIINFGFLKKKMASDSRPEFLKSNIFSWSTFSGLIHHILEPTNLPMGRSSHIIACQIGHSSQLLQS